jgi:hypothetical protein
MKPYMIFAAALAFVSCGSTVEVRESGPPKKVHHDFQLAKAEMLDAEIQLGAGKLILSGGGKKAGTADFDYSDNSLEPQYRFDTSDFRSRLSVSQRSGAVSIGGTNRNEWRFQLPDDVETDLSVKVGAGDVDLRAGSVDFRKLSLKMGAGRAEIDLRGERRRDLDIQIEGGVGECVLTLPRSAGIRAEIKGGLGHIDVSGLDKQGDYYLSPGYEAAKFKIRLKASGGIGEIRIRVE